DGGRSDLRAWPTGFTAPPYWPGVRPRPGGRLLARPRRRAGQEIQGRGYVLRAVGICAPGRPESEWRDQGPPPRGDPAPPRRQRNDSPGEEQGIGIVARNRSAALRTPEGRSMKTSRLGLAAGPSHSPSRTHARQAVVSHTPTQGPRQERCELARRLPMPGKAAESTLPPRSAGHRRGVAAVLGQAPTWGTDGGWKERKLSGRSETCHARGTEGRAAGWLAVDCPAASVRNRAGCHVWHALCVS